MSSAKKNNILGIIAALILATFTAFARCQTYSDLWFPDQTVNSLSMQKWKSTTDAETAKRSKPLLRKTNSSTCLQKLSGTIIVTSYGERAKEVGVPSGIFEGIANQKIALLLLDKPANISARNHGSDHSISERLVATLKVPDKYSDGVQVFAEIDDGYFWPSDISGELWDLDIS